MNSLRRNTIRLTVAGIAAAGIDFLYRVIVSRRLGAGTLGLFSLIMPVYAICNAIIASGLPVAVMRLAAPHKDAPAERRGIVRAASLLILGVASVIALLIVLFREGLATFLRIDGQGQSLLVLALLVFVTGFDNLFYSYFYAVDEIRVPSFAQVLEQLLRLAVLLVLLPFISRLTDSYAVVARLLRLRFRRVQEHKVWRAGTIKSQFARAAVHVRGRVAAIERNAPEHLLAARQVFLLFVVQTFVRPVASGQRHWYEMR